LGPLAMTVLEEWMIPVGVRVHVRVPRRKMELVHVAVIEVTVATVAGSAIAVSTTTVRAAWRATGRVVTTAAEEVRGTVWSVPRGTPEVGATREQSVKM
jgi:hypothetical protein